MSDPTDDILRPLEAVSDFLDGCGDQLPNKWARIAVDNGIFEIERLRAGGCARNQRTTQYCAEAETLAGELERVKIALANAISQRDTIRKIVLEDAEGDLGFVQYQVRGALGLMA
jgi:hypothetical protein